MGSVSGDVWLCRPPPGVGTVESEDGAKKKVEQDDEGGFLEELLAIFEEHQKVSEMFDGK